VEDRLRELSAQGDPLEKFAATVDFEMFLADLVAALGRGDPSKSLEQTEYLVADRLSWMRFCGLGPGDAVRDANTLWDFREALIAAEVIDELFVRLDRAITGEQANATGPREPVHGYLAMSGQILDVEPLLRHWSKRQWRGLVAAPRQRNTEAEKAAIKAGKSARSGRRSPRRRGRRNSPMERQWSERHWRMTRAGMRRMRKLSGDSFPDE
jgi:transposase, IS5 family